MNADNLLPDQVQLYAALSGPFIPKEALRSLAPPVGVDRLVMAATALAESCDTSPVGASERWLMRTSARHALLNSLNPSQLAAAVAARRAKHPDPETADLLAVLLDEPPLARANIRAVLAARTTTVSSEHLIIALERVIIALDRAGEAAPARDLLQPARSALAEIHRNENLRRVGERGFVGREDECAQVAQWLSHPVDAPPTTCLFITGGPGIGKSTLLAESVRLYFESHQPLILRLDFDRAGLDVQDQRGLTMEAARQLGEQLGEAGSRLMNARLDAGRISELNPSARSRLNLRRGLPEPLASMLGESVAAAGRPVLVVLDTLEVLRGRGETHPETLFDWLDALVAKGVKPMHVLAAGRGDALDSLRQIGDASVDGSTASSGPARVRRLELTGLRDDAALALLNILEAPRHLQPELLALAQGNPLKLRLAAEVAKRSGIEHLRKRKRGSEIDAAFLYRMLLSRIDDPDLRRLAHPGLIVRRINAELIRTVLAPTLGLGRITAERADELLRQLATHHWLVEYDAGAPGFLKHRSDMRMLLLPLLYQSATKQSARVDAAAMRWFAARPESWAQVEAMYHRLQLTRVRRDTPIVPIQLAAQFDAEALEELPRAAADLVRATRGERTSQFRGSVPASGSWDDEVDVSREIQAVLQRQDWREGAYIVRRIVHAGGLDARSEAADAIRTFLWRSGQWAQARRWLAERDRFDNTDDDLARLPEPLALARLEMRAEFTPERLRKGWQDWRPLLEQLQRAAVSAKDSCARHGALALLLSNLSEPFYFPRVDSRESDLAAAANERWAGAKGDQAMLAQELGHQQFRRVASGDVDQLSFGQLIATLTPYSAFAENLSITDGGDWLRAAAELSVDTFATADRLVGAGQLRPVGLRSDNQIGWLTGAGLFAEWAEAISFVRRNSELRLIGRAAERWRKTMAGNWSIGRRHGPWRRLPPVDETIQSRLLDLMEATDSRLRAHEDLDLWATALKTKALLPILRRRLPRLQAEVARLEEENAGPELITRRLLACGAPAAFVPPLAVLIMHREF
ncbi:hypothetical protein RN01_07410 [Cupriavidus sp. SHE]|uniref:ATP-binding protein n=1 Tax=Cupriavidus metallidurans TaxID=119219 RepID=A0A482ILE0_9BURK|nr:MULTISPECIES: ATP-binding protein [Cupriavidus]KWR84323.1 hypothetical protein RN01_07410 [Cupriavidus sp. SHE]QBP09925.1 ATP-binding protein [Cupriavidus metallidurans]